MTILQQWHVDYAGTGTWVDVTDRIEGQARFTEGRRPSELGGPLPPAAPSTLTVVLSNHDGFFTKGAGMAFGPGSLIRLQWRATTGDSWATRYTGKLSEYDARRENEHSIIQCRFYGRLIALTAGELPARSYGGGTPQRTIGLMCDTLGIPDADRDFDTDTDNFPFTATLHGWAGVLQFANLVEGLIYDTPDHKIRLELPDTRTGKTVSERFSDRAVAGEIEVPPPEVLINPFGIINHVTAELRVYEPTTGDMGIGVGMAMSQTYFQATANSTENRDFVFTVPIGFEPSDGLIIAEWSVTISANRFGTVRAFPNRLDDPNTTLAEQSVTFTGTSMAMIEITGFVTQVVGDTVMVTVSTTLTLSNADGVNWNISLSRIGGDLASGALGVRDLYAVLQHSETFGTSVEDLTSQQTHGVRRRSRPLVASQFVADLSSFTPDLTFLEERAQAELDRFKDPQRAFVLSTNIVDNASRDRILARRISDKVNLRLDDNGPTQYDIDAECFVEHLDTTIDPHGNVGQLVWLVEA